MDFQLTIILLSTVLASVIVAAVTAFTVARFSELALSRRLHGAEEEIEALESKIARRTQRENASKAQDAKSADQELEDLARRAAAGAIPDNTPQRRTGIHPKLLTRFKR